MYLLYLLYKKFTFHNFSCRSAYCKKDQKTADKKRNEELYSAAEKEEQALIAEQKAIGELLSKQNNWSVLGKLYGLTQDQIDRLQGTGRYAPVSYGGGGGGGGSGGGGGGGDDEGYYQGWSNKTLQAMAASEDIIAARMA